MKYADAVELCNRAQVELRDGKNIFVRCPVAYAQLNKNEVLWQVGIRRVFVNEEDINNIKTFCMRSGKTFSIQPAQPERHPDDVFQPVVGMWHSESLIIIIQ